MSFEYVVVHFCLFLIKNIVILLELHMDVKSEFTFFWIMVTNDIIIKMLCYFSTYQSVKQKIHMLELNINK